MKRSDLQHSLREIHTLLTQAMANSDKNRGAIDELIDQAEEKLSELEDEIEADDE
jgi:HPt (histidine-containing phosphotransfer) domain-containing protein